MRTPRCSRRADPSGPDCGPSGPPPTCRLCASRPAGHTPGGRPAPARRFLQFPPGARRIGVVSAAPGPCLRSGAATPFGAPCTSAVATSLRSVAALDNPHAAAMPSRRASSTSDIRVVALGITRRMICQATRLPGKRRSSPDAGFSRNARAVDAGTQTGPSRSLARSQSSRRVTGTPARGRRSRRRGSAARRGLPMSDSRDG